MIPLRTLYSQYTKEPAPQEARLLHELQTESKQRQEIIRRMMRGDTSRDIAERYKISHGAVIGQAKRALLAIRKRILALPRYDHIGHPGPPPELRHVPGRPPKRKPGRPRTQGPRCRCGRYTKATAQARHHRCPPKVRR